MIWRERVDKFSGAEDLQQIRKEAQIEIMKYILDSLCKSELNANGRNLINTRITELMKEIENLQIWTSTN